MSMSSGRVGQGSFHESLERATFTDPATGAKYSVTPGGEGYRLAFSREGAGVQGERLLAFFVGSGRVGRSYLYSLGGFLFQSPVSYYSQAARWDISPGYQRYQSIHLTRGVETACLQCHASRLQPTAGTQNGFGSVPFLEGGIGCERCHGPGGTHVARMKSGGGAGPRSIVNPAKLDAARRDSVCAQCHLTGAARIARARGTGETYRPGLLLSDFSAVFVWSGADTDGMSVNSHFEKLQQSTCKSASGDRLWCGSCHDPHGEPDPAARPAYYRARCAKCHPASNCKESARVRAASQDDCAGCHMPKSAVRDNLHAVYTDHSIPRRPRHFAAGAGTAVAGRSLVSFWKTAADPRDQALAYASVAGGDMELRQTALALLEQAEKRSPADMPVLSQLSQIYDRMGDEEKAMAICERIVRADSTEITARINLGTYLIKRGRTREAIGLWEEVLAKNPGLTEVRINLAVAQYRAGDAAAAALSIKRALEFEPDDPTARQLEAELAAAGR